jgi:Neurolysin/Thimet oligopeptidase, N-terminal domain
MTNVHALMHASNTARAANACCNAHRVAAQSQSQASLLTASPGPPTLLDRTAVLPCTALYHPVPPCTALLPMTMTTTTIQGVQDSDALRAAVEEVQPDNVALGLRLSQSRPLYEAFKALK